MILNSSLCHIRYPEHMAFISLIYSTLKIENGSQGLLPVFCFCFIPPYQRVWGTKSPKVLFLVLPLALGGIPFAKNAKEIPLRHAPGRIFAKNAKMLLVKGGGKSKIKTLGAIPQPPFFFQYFFNQPSNMTSTK